MLSLHSVYLLAMRAFKALTKCDLQPAFESSFSVLLLLEIFGSAYTLQNCMYNTVTLQLIFVGALLSAFKQLGRAWMRADC